MKKLITMLSALIITSSLAPLTVACGKERGIDLSEITADTIINWESEYKYNKEKEEKTVKSDKLGSLALSNNDILNKIVQFLCI